eukprot:m.101539 g.101539  ORF g.101539 m.101539 type:complete len:836 (+) comp14981_c0_seq1:109-2616(+)
MSEAAVEAWQAKALQDGHLSSEDPSLLFDLLEPIGHGATADIVKAVDRKTGDVVAIKKFKTKLKTEDDWKDIIKEIVFLKKCRSKYLVNFHGSYLHGKQVWIVMDYCLGSCFDIMELFKQPFAEAEIKAVCWGILKALEYLHSNQKIHRDIKARNILLADTAEVKLCDFGASADVSDRDDRANTFIGSPYWLAPEVIMAMDTGTYSYPADVWSLGITLIEIAETKPPLFHLQAMSALFRIPTNPSPELTTSGWSDNFKTFLARCLDKDPDSRASVKELLQHPFMAGVEEQAKQILRDLIDRSKAAVRGEIDLTVLKESGLISNVRPDASQDSRNLTSVDEAPEDIDESTASEMQSMELTEPPPPVKAPARASKYNTIKLPSSLLREHQESKESSRLDVQMRARRKLQKKQEEALEALTKQQQAEITSIAKRFSEKMTEFQRQCEADEALLSKENQAACDRLEKAQALARKRHEEDLQKYVERKKRESKSTLASQLQDLKRDHRRLVKEEGADKKEMKKLVKEQTTNMQAKRKTEFKATSLAYVDANMKMLRGQQQLAAARLRFEHLEEELRRKETHLEERLQMVITQETDKVHTLMRVHRKQLHELELAYTSEREKLEVAHLQDNHAQTQVNIRRKHTIQARAHDKQLRKLSVHDQEVQEVFRRQTAQLDELQAVKEKQRKGTADRKQVKKLEKMEKQALNEARQSVVAQATIRLNESQIREFNDVRRRQEEEMNELLGFFQERRHHLDKAHQQQIADLEQQIHDQLLAAEKLKKTELSNFQKGRDTKLAHERSKLEELTKETDALVATERERIAELDQVWLTVHMDDRSGHDEM